MAGLLDRGGDCPQQNMVGWAGCMVVAAAGVGK